MKILLVSLFMPHPRAPHAGGRYVYEILKHLSARHEVHLATRYEEGEREFLDDLRPLCREIFQYSYRTVAKRTFFDNLILVANYLGFSRYADELIAQGGYDLVQVEWVESAIFIKRHKTPMILDAHDVMAKPFSRGVTGFVSRVVAVAVKNIELLLMRRFDRVVTLSDFDCDYLRGIWPKAPVISIPIPAGLDISDKVYRRKQGRILFLASFKYRPVNVAGALWFYREVFPLVKKVVPDATLTLAGYGPPPELTALESDSAVCVPGFVDDLDRCYKESAVFVAPILTGGGIIVKVLDALASGTPTVSTTYGNEGVGALDGRDILVADGPEKFADAVVNLLRNKDLAAEIGESGRSFVKAHYGRAAIMARHDALVAEILHGG